MKFAISSELMYRLLSPLVAQLEDSPPSGVGEVLVKIEASAEDGKISITINKGSPLAMTASIQADIFEGGLALAPVKALSALLGQFEPLRIHFMGKDLALSLEWLGGSATFPYTGIPWEEPPQLTYSKTVTFPVDAPLGDDLKPLVHILPDEDVVSRYGLDSIQLSWDINSACAAATDGHRLGVAPIVAIDRSEIIGSVLLPPALVAAIIAIRKNEILKWRWPDQSIDPVVVGYDESKKSACISYGAYTIYSPLAAGTFPNWRKVIPAGYVGTIAVSGDALLDAIDCVSAVAVEQLRAINLRFEPASITVTGGDLYDKDSARASQRICVEGEVASIDLNFSADYIKDALAQIRARRGYTEVKLSPSGESHPMRIEDGSGLFYLVMPIGK